MAAGQGFKTFATGDVLTAADTNGYLMQGVLVFANATARDAAITSPQEGQTCYLKDTDQIYTYSGAAWVSQAGISAGLIDAKGDLIVGSAADTAARLAVGTDGQVLTADAASTAGIKWATASSGGMTLISTTTFNNTAAYYALTSIPQTYKHLVLIGNGLQSAAAGAYGNTWLRFNNVSTASYYTAVGQNQNIGSTTTALTFGPDDRTYVTDCWANTTDAAQRFGSFKITIFNYTDTSTKNIEVLTSCASGGSPKYGFNYPQWTSTAAITEINFGQTGATNFKAGTMRLYGVS